MLIVKVKRIFLLYQKAFNYAFNYDWKGTAILDMKQQSAQ